MHLKSLQPVSLKKEQRRPGHAAAGAGQACEEDQGTDGDTQQAHHSQIRCGQKDAPVVCLDICDDPLFDLVHFWRYVDRKSRSLRAAFSRSSRQGR